MEAYAKSILDVLPKGAREVSILAGGALRAFLDGTPVKDYDLFFRNHDDAEAASCALAHAPEFTYVGRQGRAVTYRSACGKEFNLVPFAFGEPADHIARFDFRCCRFAAWYTSDKVEVLAGAFAEHDARLLSLVIVNNNGTDRTIRRAEKYVEDYGYTLVFGAASVKRTAMTTPLARLRRSNRIRRFVSAYPVTGYGHDS